jgi:hypothetical protein
VKNVRASSSGCEHIAVPVLVKNASRKKPREGTGGQALGHPDGLTYLPRGQPLGMLTEQGDNNAPAFLHLRVYSPEAGRQARFRVVVISLHGHGLCGHTPHGHRCSLGQGAEDAWSRAVRILAEDARNALFVHVAEIQHIPESGFHPSEDAVNVPSALELLEEDLECVAAMQAPRRDGTPRLIAAAIQHPIGRGRLTRHT